MMAPLRNPSLRELTLFTNAQHFTPQGHPLTATNKSLAFKVFKGESISSVLALRRTADLEQLCAFPLAPPAINDTDSTLLACFVCTFYAHFSEINAATFPALIRLFARLPPGSRHINNDLSPPDTPTKLQFLWLLNRLAIYLVMSILVSVIKKKLHHQCSRTFSEIPVVARFLFTELFLCHK